MKVICNHKWVYNGGITLTCLPPIEPRECRICGATAQYQEGRGIFNVRAEPIEVEDWPHIPS